MSFVHGKNTTFSIDDSSGSPQDISDYANNIDFPLSADVAEVTGFGDDSKEYIPGLKGATISMDLSWDAAVDAILWGIVGKTGTFSYSPDGGTTTYSGECICTAYTPASAVNDAVKGSASFQVTGDVSRA